MIFNPEVEYSSDDYITTSTNNIISRRCTIYKPQNVQIPSGRCIIHHDVLIRGDLAPVQLHKYCIIGARTVLHPSFTHTSAVETIKFIPLTIGSHCYIGEDCVIEAAVLGMGCVVGENCILSKRCILKDYVKVLDGTVIGPDTVIPPFSIVSGNPGRIIGEQHESTSTIAPLAAVDRYQAYKVRNSPLTSLRER